MFSWIQSLDFGWNWRWCDWKVVCVWHVMEKYWSLDPNFRSKHSLINYKSICSCCCGAVDLLILPVKISSRLHVWSLSWLVEMKKWWRHQHVMLPVVDETSWENRSKINIEKKYPCIVTEKNMRNLRKG